ncbi:substrate-binding periplasmic protein [Desulfovibrio ferrophilus]|uniref:Extracellular solute-binding protein family 3 n=1 Tax=Desulfovibrio ferrophilus TaxID=241368 RepID=A0A2Z6AUE7_9BACT|nr:transporter substrate-binding domain-containing protein [Desulfovibrio ferrophilus]BBD06857.1 extracellular solute-binding protein family 3 [Desulfovibrio ferrophilus]
MNSVRCCFCLFIVFMLFSLCLPGYAAQQSVRVAFSELPPWKIIEPEGEKTGVDTEFLWLVAKRMDLRLEFVEAPFVRGMRMLETGEVDMMTGVLRRGNREAFLHFIEPSYRHDSNKAFYLRKGQGHLIQSYADLYGLTIGVGRGGKYFPKFDNDLRIRKEAVSDGRQNIKKLLHGRFDAFIQTETAADYLIRKLNLEDNIEKAPYVYHEVQPVYMVLSKRSVFASRLGEFSQMVRDLLREGEYDRLRWRYLAH